MAMLSHTVYYKYQSNIFKISYCN